MNPSDEHEPPISGQATVIVIDDDPEIRDQLAALFSEAGMAVRCFAAAEDFLAAYSPMQHACAIVDMTLMGMDGMQLLAALAAREIPLPVIFLTGYGDVPSSVRALKAGAFDYLCKPVSGAALLASVRAALKAGEQLNRHFQRMHDASTLLGALTGREREVLRLAVDGLTNKVIARRLGISHRTVEIHKARIMRKTGADNILALAHLVESCPAFLAD